MIYFMLVLKTVAYGINSCHINVTQQPKKLICYNFNRRDNFGLKYKVQLVRDKWTTRANTTHCFISIMHLYVDSDSIPGFLINLNYRGQVTIERIAVRLQIKPKTEQLLVKPIILYNLLNYYHPIMVAIGTVNTHHLYQPFINQKIINQYKQ